MRTLEYKAGDEADRLRVVNSVESARFSIKEDTTAKRLKKLEQENEQLRERVEWLRGQTDFIRNYGHAWQFRDETIRDFLDWLPRTAPYAGQKRRI